jgi:hypothetical protein
MTAPTVSIHSGCSSEREQRFREILRLSGSMLDQAQRGDWVAVSATEAARQRLISGFFESAASAHEAVWLAAGIREVLAYDRQLMDLGNQTMAGLSAELRTFETGRRAQAAYSGR